MKTDNWSPAGPLESNIKSATSAWCVVYYQHLCCATRKEHMKRQVSSASSTAQDNITQLVHSDLPAKACNQHWLLWNMETFQQKHLYSSKLFCTHSKSLIKPKPKQLFYLCQESNVPQTSCSMYAHAHT